MENNFNFSYTYLSGILSFNGLCNEPPPKKKKHWNETEFVLLQFVSYFTWVWNLVSHPEGETWVEVFENRVLKTYVA